MTAGRIAAVDLHKEKVMLETDRYRLEGSMTLPAEGFGSRLSDYVNRRDVEFFTLQDVTLTPLDGGRDWQASVLMVASRHIRLISPGEEIPSG
jgi:hypothetical protein